jgi:hypothetical protein
MREAFAHADSRRVRLLALLGVAAALLLVRAETSHAAFSFSGGALATEAAEAESTTGATVCSSPVGPCFFIAVTVIGGGRVESTADPAGTMVRCPPQGEHGCTVPEWFIWALDVTNPFIDFTPVATTGGFTGWSGPYTPVCHQEIGIVCRIYANSLDSQSYEHCITANFTPGTPTVGACVEGTPPPVGDPIVVQKAGTGTGTVQSNPVGINCGTICTAVFPISTDPVTLFATAAAGSTFAGWSGVGHSCSGTGACPITVQGQTIRAVATFNAIGPPPPPPPPAVLNAVILSKPAKTTRSRTARFTWGAKRNGVFKNPFRSQCRLNKQVWKACSPPKTYRDLRRGRTHTFRVRVRDGLNPKWDPTPAVWSWRIRR